jgi:hypothetical protein
MVLVKGGGDLREPIVTLRSIVVQRMRLQGIQVHALKERHPPTFDNGMRWTIYAQIRRGTKHAFGVAAIDLLAEEDGRSVRAVVRCWRRR